MNSSLNAARETASLLRKAKDYRGAAEILHEQLAASEGIQGSDAARLAKDFHSAGEMSTAHEWAIKVPRSQDDLTAWQRASGLLLGNDAMPAKRRIKIAILGTWTTNYFSPMLRLALASRGIAAEIHEAGYDQLDIELRDPNSGTRQFEPELIVLATHETSLRFDMTLADAESVVAAEAARWKGLWDIAATNFSAPVIQHGFIARRTAALGHVAGADPMNRSSLIGALNAELQQGNDQVGFVDCAQIAAEIGHTQWFDDRYWFLSKLAVSLTAHPLLARHTSAVIAAQLGLTKKCVVLDLDDTLWSGLIGEDGLNGIRLNGTPDGEAHLELQRHLLELKDRGILLTVCSKNEHKNAVLPFEKHPDMLLKLSDFSAFKANWKSKADNIQEIAQELDLGLDSFVFIDDSPLERREVRTRLPEVDVLPMTKQAEEYPEILRSYLGFETISITAEDRMRSQQYQARAAAKSLETSAGSLEDFYEELQLEANFAGITDANITRVTQLIQKSNQFNLTTIRRSRTEIEAFLDDPTNSGIAVRLQDRYTDHGLIAVLLTSVTQDAMKIDTWVMSCRVIGRTVEQSIIRHVAEKAASVGCVGIIGDYLPTQKNALVSDLYDHLGFSPLPGNDSGGTHWEVEAASIEENRFISSSSTPAEQKT